MFGRIYKFLPWSTGTDENDRVKLIMPGRTTAYRDNRMRADLAGCVTSRRHERNANDPDRIEFFRLRRRRCQRSLLMGRLGEQREADLIHTGFDFRSPRLNALGRRIIALSIANRSDADRMAELRDLFGEVLPDLEPEEPLRLLLEEAAHARSLRETAET